MNLGCATNEQTESQTVSVATRNEKVRFVQELGARH